MKITPQLVDKLSALSRIRLSPEEKQAMAGELEGIIRLMDVLDGLDAAEDVYGPTAGQGALREDEVGTCLPRQELLAAAPAHDGEMFLIPRTVE